MGESEGGHAAVAGDAQGERLVVADGGGEDGGGRAAAGRGPGGGRRAGEPYTYVAARHAALELVGEAFGDDTARVQHGDAVGQPVGPLRTGSCALMAPRQGCGTRTPSG